MSKVTHVCFGCVLHEPHSEPVMHQSIPAVSIPPGISGPFFLIVCPGGAGIVYPGAFDRFRDFHVTALLLSFSDKFVGRGG